MLAVVTPDTPPDVVRRRHSKEYQRDRKKGKQHPEMGQRLCRRRIQKQGNSDAERDCQAVGDAAPDAGQQGQEHKPKQAEQSRNSPKQPRHEPFRQGGRKNVKRSRSRMAEIWARMRGVLK